MSAKNDEKDLPISHGSTYYLDSLTAPDNETATPKSTAQFASGEVTWLLNGSKDAPSGPWYQNIGTDPYPVLDPTHAAVYKTSTGYDNLRFSSISTPSTINVNGGISLVELVSKLPKTVTVNSNIGSSSADVTWDTSNISYDPESFDRQTVKVNGTVNVTGMLNGGKKNTTATVNVKAVTVTNLTASTTPNLIYSQSGKLDLSALRLTAQLSNGKAQIVEHDTQGVTFKLGGTTIQDGLTLDKAQHSGKSLTVTYRGKTVDLGTLAVKSTNNFISNLTVSGQEAQYENGGYAVTLPPYSSLPSDGEIMVALAEPDTASVTGKTELDRTGDEAQWEISVQAENGDVATYPLTVTVSPDYVRINEEAVDDFKLAWGSLSNITWNPTQAEVQQDVTTAGATHEQQLTYWLTNKLFEAGLEIPDNATLEIAYTSGPDWAEKGDRYNHGGTEGSFTFTLTFTATAGDGSQNKSVFFEGNAGTITPIRYNAPKYTVNFDSQGGSPVSSSSIQVTEDTPIGDQWPDDPVKADHRFTGWYTETGVLWDPDSPVTTNPLNLHAGWRWSQSVTDIVNGGRIKAANEDAVRAGAYGEGLRMGDTVSITASATLTEEPGPTNTFTTEPEHFEFYLGAPSSKKSLGKVPATIEQDGSYTATLEIDLTGAKGRSFADGQNTIHVVFSGGDQLDGSNASTTLDIGKAMFTVTFDRQDGSPVENQYVVDGDCATEFSDPTWTDHRFTGWESGGRAFSFSDPITGNTNVTASWEWAKSDTGVTIDLVRAGNPDAPRKTDVYHIGDDVSIIATVKPAERPSESNAISLDDGHFDFYVGDPNSGGTPLGTVSAKEDGEGGYSATLENINLGTTTGLTEVGTYDIYAVFSGNSTINPSEKHTTLNVRPQLHTVTFNSDGGSAVQNKYVEDSTPIGTLDAPSKANHRFTGWVDDNGVPYTSNTLVTGPVTLTATWAWSKSETSVSFQWVSAGNPAAGENGSPIRIGDTVSVTAFAALTAQSNSMLLSEPVFTFYAGDPSTGIRLDSVAAQSTGGSYTASLNVPLNGKGFDVAGNYRIYAVFSGGGALDGSSGYAELTVAPAIYTVTFNSNGGTPVEPQQYIEQGKKITEPDEPTKEGSYFNGWAQENGQPWDFERDTVHGPVTLTARWSDDPVFDIDGSVTDNSGNALSNIKITLQRGKQIVFQTETDSSGQYHFHKVSPGFYNIVAERTVAGGKTQTVTALTEIIDQNAAVPQITMPPENISSVLELPANAPNIMVGGLNEEAIAQAGGTTDIVTVSMAVAPKALVTGTPETSEAVQLQEEQRAIQQQAGSRTLDFLEIAIIKDVAGTTSNITQTTNILEIIVDFQFNDRQNIAVYHYHNGQAEALKEVSGRTRSGQEDGTYYLDRENGLIHIFTQRFSLYAIGYQPVTRPDPPDHGNSGGGDYYIETYSVTIEKSEHGKVTSNRTYAASGNTVTLTVTPDSGYVLDALAVTDSLGREIRLTPQGDGKYTFTMPSRAVKVNATFAPLPDEVDKPCDGGMDCPSRGFTDLGTVGTWYHEAVDYVLRNGLMGGYGGGRFGPNDYLSRAQFAQILHNKEGRQVVNYLMRFGDVPDGLWYTEAVRWAAAMGIVGGYDNGNFGPNDNITREQLAAMLWRYAGSPAATNKELHFTDEDEISGYALEAIRWAVENGIMGGYGDGRLGPKGLATRAQAAQMLKNFIENQEENT